MNQSKPELQQVLLLGGPCDGYRFTVSDFMDYCYVNYVPPVSPEEMAYVFSDVERAHHYDCKLHRALYHRNAIIVDGKPLHVFTYPPGASAEWIISRLLAKYPTPQP